MAWETLIEQGRKSLGDPDFDHRERDYKLEIAEAVRRARDGTVITNREALVQATIDPTNTITFGAAEHSPCRTPAGVSVSGPATVDKPGDGHVTLSATGKKRKELNRRGKVAVAFVATFTPNGRTAGISSEYLTLRKKPD
jgi:hypothetical protein